MSSTAALPQQMWAVRIHEFGGSKALQHEQVALPTCSLTQLLVQLSHAGINYIDTYHRNGLYPNALPLTIGREGSGRVVACGAQVPASSFSPGDRVVFFAPGSYAQYAAVDASACYRLPEAISTKTAAAAYLQGLTAHYLATTTYPIRQGDHVLIHAAAGGTGSLLVQFAKQRGAIVIGTVGSAAKAAIAKAAGADHVINYNECDFLDEVKRITANVGVAVVYDGVGLATYERSMKSLKKLGYLVCFGNASGPVPPIAPLELTKHGSIFLTRPTLNDYVATRAELERRADEVFAAIAAGNLKIDIAQMLPLAQAAQAHDLLEGRSIAGKILLEIDSTVM